MPKTQKVLDAFTDKYTHIVCIRHNDSAPSTFYLYVQHGRSRKLVAKYQTMREVYRHIWNEVAVNIW